MAPDKRGVRRLVWENTKLGPFVQLRMLMAALPWTLYGISKAGARASIAAVDSERQATVAAIACKLVRYFCTSALCLTSVTQPSVNSHGHRLSHRKGVSYL